MVRQRVRIRFRKQGDLRWIGHLDLARAWERLFRRSGIPLAMSVGFHPKPKVQFPSALALSVEGLDEVVEVQIDSDLPPEQLLAVLAPHAPAGLVITSIELAPGQRAAQVRGVAYELPIPRERLAQVQERLDGLLSARECLVDRGRDRKPLDLRARLTLSALDDGVLRLRMRVTREGGIKPSEVLAVLGVDDLPRAGHHLTRTTVELDDDATAHESSIKERSIALPNEKA